MVLVLIGVINIYINKQRKIQKIMERGGGKGEKRLSFFFFLFSNPEGGGEEGVMIS